MLRSLNENKYLNMKSLCSPSSAKTYKTFKSSGKIKLPKLIGKRENIQLSWSIKGFETIPLSCPQKKPKIFFSFPPVKSKVKNLKKIRLKDEIINAVNDEMKTIQKLISVKSCKKKNKNNDNSSNTFTVKTKDRFKNSEHQNHHTIKKTFSFEFDEFNVEMIENQRLVSNIKKKINSCSQVSDKANQCWINKESNDMNNNYNSFKKNNFDQLVGVLLKYFIDNKADKLSQFIMKFLLDIQSKSDVETLNPYEILILEKFLIDRYFKLLRQKIIDSLMKNGIFKSFLESCQFHSKEYKIQFSISKMNEFIYQKYIEIFISKNFFQNTSFNIFNEAFEKIFNNPVTNSKNLFEFLKNFYFEINHLISFLIIKLISQRFESVGFVFNDIELIHNDIVFLISSIVQILENLNKDSTTNDKKLIFFQKISKMLKPIFEKQDSKMYFVIIKYIKYREMREYMGRKRKSEFVKPRRNDEKLKKIYKRIMKTLFSDFKKSHHDEDETETIKQNKDLNEIKFEEYLNKESSKLFLTDSDEEGSIMSSFIKNASSSKTKRETLKMMTVEEDRNQFKFGSKSTVYKRSSELKMSHYKYKTTRFSNKEQEKEFYEFYFKKIANELKIPLNYFFDPLKQKFGNKKYKSFTVKYFNLLLQADQFKLKVKQYLQDNQLVLDMLTEYSKQLKDIFNSVPTILIDQHKPKSKFLWTSYEFYFAMFFFKDKFKLQCI
jgi:hypothetical protein